MEYEVSQPLKALELGIRIMTADGTPVLTSIVSDSNPRVLDVEKLGAYRAIVTVPGMFLMPGSYLMNVVAHLSVGEVFDFLPGVFSFTILDTGTNYTKYHHNHLIGVVMKMLPWRDEAILPQPAWDLIQQAESTVKI